MKDRWISLHGHSYYSLLDGISSPEKLVKRAANLNMAALAISDHGSIGGAVKHELAAHKAGIKPLRAVEFYIKDPEFERSTHLVTLAKNLTGYKQLLKMVTLSNTHDNFYRNPRLTREQFGELCDGNIIVLNGHCGSSLANILFTDINKAYAAKTEDEVRSYLKPDAKKIATKLAEEYVGMVGAENFFVEIQKQDERFVAGRVIAAVLREVAGNKFKKAATCDFHYSNKTDAQDQRVVLCKYLDKTLNEAEKAAKADEDFSLGGFFKSEMYYMLTPQEMYEFHKDAEDEIANTTLIADMIED
jgi:DNA polymerase-3 subunit alpha